MTRGNDWDNFPEDIKQPFRRVGSDPSLPQGYQPSSPPGNSGGRVLLWVFGIIGLISCLAAIACCGVVYFSIHTVRTELAKQVQRQVGTSSEIAEHIGEIESMDLSFQAMGDPANAGKMVFEIRGPRGSGQLVIDPTRMESDPNNAFVLILEDGRRIPLVDVESDPDAAPVDREDAESLDGDAVNKAPAESEVPSGVEPVAVD